MELLKEKVRGYGEEPKTWLFELQAQHDRLELLDLIKLMHHRSNKTGFVFSLKKTVLGSQEVEALGHKITTEGRCAADGKVKLISDWKMPTDVQNLKSFVCVVIYLREYVWKLADKMEPLKPYLMKFNQTRSRRI